MRYVALAIIILSLPLLIGMIGRDPKKRDMAMMAMGVLMFCTGTLDLSAALVVWPMWQGLSKGMFLSLLDTIAVALIATRPGRLNRVYFGPLIAIFAAPILLSVAVAAQKQAALFIVYQVAQMTVYYVALSGEMQRPSAIVSMLRGAAVGLMIQVGYVIWQKAHGAVQAPGTFDHQNILGVIVELSALPLLAAVLEGERSKLVYGGLLAALIILAGGGSRGAMLYFAIGGALLFVLSLIRRNTSRKWSMAGVAALAAAAAVPMALATLNERFDGGPVTTQENERAAFEKAAKLIAADHPFGVGANNFVTVNNTGGYAARAGLDWSPFLRSKPAHNAFLVARAETGWAGEIALFILLGGLIGAGLRASFQTRNIALYGVPLGCAAAIFAAALHSGYEYTMLTAVTQRFLFMNAAIISGCVLLMQRTKAQHRKVGKAAAQEVAAMEAAGQRG